MKKAFLYKKLNNKKTQCQNCAHYCLLKDNETGKCKVRKNINGEVFSLNYGNLGAINIDPIEKKPLYHFLPGTEALSIGLPGCSLSCKNCQNWKLAKKPKEYPTENLSPSKIISLAKEKEIPTIAYTYSEPSMSLEYSLETMKLASKEGIKNIWVSNGFFSKECRKKILPFLDAINIDLKGFSEKFYKRICNGSLKPVLNTIEGLSGQTHLEITTLLIPSYVTKNQLKKMAKFIAGLDDEIPWHITQFSPQVSWKMKKVDKTKAEDLFLAQKIGKEAGLKYVYANKNNTKCPNCDSMVVERNLYQINRRDSKGRCPQCNQKIFKNA